MHNIVAADILRIGILSESSMIDISWDRHD